MYASKLHRHSSSTGCCLFDACRVSRQVAMQHNKFVAASSAAKLRTREEEELKAMVAEQERRATEFEKLFHLVGTPGWFDPECCHADQAAPCCCIIAVLCHLLVLQVGVQLASQAVQHMLALQAPQARRLLRLTHGPCWQAGSWCDSTFTGPLCCKMRGSHLLFACVPLLGLNSQGRNQRNRFVALIATARQAGAEMTDRLRLLSSEQEILTAEVASKAQLLDKVHNGNTP